jgi:hypothetical protein
MSRTTDLPAVAWEVLALIQSGTPLAGDPQIVWARAFEQSNWVASRGGVRVLTADGVAALQERSALAGVAKAQG